MMDICRKGGSGLRFKKTVILAVAALLGLMVGWTLPARAAFNIDARAAILMDPVSGRVLFAQDEHQRLPPASVTKVMTMLLILEDIHSGRAHWNDPITTSAVAATMGGSQVYLKEGETFPLKELFKTVAVVSANDSSAAIAEHLYGSVQDFVEAMNEKARELGLKNTHFANETGLPDPGHYSSAYDLAVISRELVQYPEIFEFTSIWLDKFRDGQFMLRNTNELIQVYRGCDGLKTGHTDEAKFCLSATAKRGDFRLLSVVLGAETNAKRLAESRRLLDYGYRNFQWKTIKESKGTVGQVSIIAAQKQLVPVKLKGDLGTVVERGKDQLIETRIAVDPKLKLPVAAGGRIGTMTATLNGKTVARAPVYAVERVEQANFLTRLWRGLRDFFTGLFRKSAR
jgi:D-alanyl-D-alanine carboxypeptidase (penicillin-binding protein 5/6)